MQRRWILLGLVLVAAIGGWAAFRPERLWINTTVDEELDAVADPMTAAAAPVTAAADARMPMPLSAGRFHSGAHLKMNRERSGIACRQLRRCHGGRHR